MLTALGKQIAQHVAAAHPLALSADDLDAELIERERSIATTTLLVEARFVAWRPTTALPFSVSVGGAAVAATGATTVTRTVG